MKLTSFVTRDYFPAFASLAYTLSIIGKVTGLEWHVVWGDEPAQDYELIFERLGFTPVTYRMEDFNAEVPDIEGTAEYLMFTKNKLLLHLLPEADYIYLDVDMVCKKDAREMLTFKPFSAMSRPGIDDFCGGFMVFRPSREAYDVIVNEIIPSKKNWRLSDQDVLNEYYRVRLDCVNNVPWKWNTGWKEARRQPDWDDLFSDAIFIHYHGRIKPWDYPPYLGDGHRLWWELHQNMLVYFGT